MQEWSIISRLVTNRPAIMTVQHIDIRYHANGRIRQAAVVKAGRWVFATGLRALDDRGGLSEKVLCSGRPLDPPPRAQREAEHIFRSLGDALRRAGSSLSRIVRLDQYYPDWRSVDPYHVARKQALGAIIAPSTSILVDGLLNTDALMDIQAIATTDDSDLSAVPVGSDTIGAPSESGYSPCLRVGDLVFVAGQLARDGSGRIAPEAMVPEGQLWKGTRIKLETKYLLEKRLIPALAAAGSSMDSVLKAQVYLSRAEDFSAFWQVWATAFKGKVPPTTVIPVRHPGFGTEAATIEVNLVAAQDGRRGDIRDISADVVLPAPGMIAARVFDDLLFVAGLMAVDEAGLVSSAKVDPSAPFYGNGTEQQMADILVKADKIFRAAGTDLSQLTRALHFVQELSDFADIHDAWRHSGTDGDLPFSAVQVGPDLFVPGARVIADFWGYVPHV